MAIESDEHSRGNPFLYKLVKHSPKTGKSPTVWAWPQLMDYLKIAGQPCTGVLAAASGTAPRPGGGHLPVAVADPRPMSPRWTPSARA